MVTFGMAGNAAVAAPAAALVSGGDLLLRERARPVVPSGFRPLDALLPAGGIRPGSLVEWLAEGNGVSGGGAAALAFAVACRLAAAGGANGGGVSDSSQARPRTIVVVDRSGWFHPPAVLPWLDDERRLVVARPSRDDDEIWTIDQALRCTGVAAVLAWPRMKPRVPQSGSRLAGSFQQWSTAMRRWQLAAAGSGAVGLFVRPRASLGEPSWAEARIAVSPKPGGTLLERRLRLTLAGGNWSAVTADSQPTADVVLDLARGCVGASQPGASMNGMSSGKAGVRCRAS
ncbi:MAG: hypothetical protein K8S94_07170 [Planctomycetia bacterium]|nr:hypothetical protein [Planctomycetia bacterium]